MIIALGITPWQPEPLSWGGMLEYWDIDDIYGCRMMTQMPFEVEEVE
jgi:hypothetical protein